jgi:predicted PurR-regulated permease PerM
MPVKPEPPAVTLASQRALIIIATSIVLALLYVGKDVFVPVILAVILGLLMAPLVRKLQRIGLGHTSAVSIAVLVLALFVAGLMTVIGSQIVHLASSLPQYQRTIHDKLQVVHDISIGRLDAVRGEAGKMMAPFGAQDNSGGLNGASAPTQTSSAPINANSTELPTVTGSAWAAIRQVLSSVWSPLETAGIVLIVLIFVLLEYESLRDRFIRLIGGADLRATTLAINDAAERLSRFFVSQFSVNFGVGVVIWLGLAAIGLPNALLWGVLTAILRFVPYVGVWLAAILAVSLAAAVTPGWALMLMTLGLFVVVEAIVSQLVEPQLYGHATGLSPLAVVVAAIFWSWLWGPVGLVLSTPLTLCLVVAGRHVRALALLEVLLGDTPALTMPQRFYQRALSGDSDEIITSARVFLRSKSFARYCDVVLWPALQLAYMDMQRGVITPEQQLKARAVVARVIEMLGSETRSRPLWRRSVFVMEDNNIGHYLRQQRERVSGRWQGPLAVAPRSVVLCIGSGVRDDDLVTEILVRVLRDLNIDARHVSLKDIEAFEAEPHPEATPNAVSMVHVVSAAASDEWEQADSVAKEMRSRFADARIVAVVLPELLEIPKPLMPGPHVDHVVKSFEEAAQQSLTDSTENA